MKIISNYEINENKWKEFIYVFFKNVDDEVIIEVKDLGDSIYIKSKNHDNMVEYSILKMIDNQIDVMLKASLLKLYNIN
ncbi:hypothetical protein NQ652_17965, partial [Acinetobacter baumannii]|nr:hypothetical protein [Acinetobacter baumannii]